MADVKWPITTTTKHGCCVRLEEGEQDRRRFCDQHPAKRTSRTAQKEVAEILSPYKDPVLFEVLIPL